MHRLAARDQEATNPVRPQRGGTSLSPAARDAGDIPLLLVTLVSAASSIAALLLHAVGWIRMPYTVSFVTLPGLILLSCLTVWSGRTQHALLSNRLRTGMVAGALGLVAYDGMRAVVQLLPLNFDAFFSMPAFGTLMTGHPPDSFIAIASGWAYHITNGWTFAVIYALLAGPARWWWGLAWGFTLELAMIVVYPALFRPSSLHGFLVVSVVGHAAFGTVVGRWCEGHAVGAKT